MAGLKRKFEDDIPDTKLDTARKEGEEEEEDGIQVNVNSLIPDDYTAASEGQQDDEEDLDIDDETAVEDFGDHPTHDESNEPLPPCAIYDKRIGDVEERLTAIPRRFVTLGTQQECKSTILQTHIDQAKKLFTIPEPLKYRIAILGVAGAGKSSLLNAVTGEHNMAKAISHGQSCTAVPTEYQGEFPKQRLKYGAMIKYSKPEQIPRSLKELLQDYNIYAFESDKNWDEDTRTAAKKAHENAFKSLRALFINLPSFKTKADATKCLASVYKKNEAAFLEELFQDCKLKLRYTAKAAYTEWHEAETLAKLRKAIDPLITSTGHSDQPALWPLARHVFIGVRGSRVLEKVTLIDLPGISDTNQARVELTHDYIKACDYIWVVAPISRVVDDGTVYQLLSRYGKAFKGNICVVCTHSDEGIIGSEKDLAAYFREEDQDTKPFTDLNEQMKAKRAEIKDLNSRIMAVKKRKSKATKQEILDTRAEEETLKDMVRQCRRLEAKRFEFFVTTRNSLISKQLQEAMKSHLPRWHRLEVHCVSNLHYAALQGTPISGPRLTAEFTGIPSLRAKAFALQAPHMQQNLDRYVNFAVKAMLQDCQLWLGTTAETSKRGLLRMSKEPHNKLVEAANARVSSFAKDIRSSSKDELHTAIPDASKAAITALDKKKEKHPCTIKAFIRKEGKHATMVCPKESWNENFSKFFADVVTRSETSLHQKRSMLTTGLERKIIADLESLKKGIRDFPASLPKADLAASIQTYIGGVRDAFTFDEEEYNKEIRNILLDVSQDSEKNEFNRKMKPIYEQCQLDSGRGVTKRCMDRLEECLSDTGAQSPFATVAIKLTNKFLSTDEKHIKKFVQPVLDELLVRLHKSVEELLDNQVVDEAESIVKAILQEAMPSLMSEWEQVSQDLEAIKAKYEDKKHANSRK